MKKRFEVKLWHGVVLFFLALWIIAKFDQYMVGQVIR